MLNDRKLISEIKENVGKKIHINGRVINIRKLGGVVFIIIGDRTGIIQTVWDKRVEGKIGDIVSAKGEINVEKRAMGGYELKGDKIEILSSNQTELPFDYSDKELDIHLNTLLDNRVLTVRHPKVQAIFKLYNILLKAYEEVMREEGFSEIKTPKILGSLTEGGANFFKIKYFDKDAYLAQSPQFYKQIMVGSLERVFEIGPVFRAEPHFTTRHINEYISFDAEMGYIDSEEDVMQMLNVVLQKIFKILARDGSESLDYFKIELPKVPDKIPSIKLEDAKKIIKDKYGYDVPKTTDIDPEGERLICKYAKEDKNSDFIFVTHYPWKDRPFYTMPADDKQGETRGFDLLYKNMEIATGSQRIHNYDDLIKNMELKKVSPKGMEFYLDIFKSGMPPHGGWGLGSERIIQLILNLASVKEATLFPRDVKRISP
jgi:nondiscriminating aspartyl-tRNA synthetase